MTEGGYPVGTTSLVSGPSGTGKTLLGLHFVVAGLQAGESSVYVTYEENPRQILKDAYNLNIDLQPSVANGQLQILHIRTRSNIPTSSGP